MKRIRLLFIISLGFLFVSCTKPQPQPIYNTSFETYTAKLDHKPYSSVSNRFLFDKMLEEEEKEAGEILKNKHLIDYKKQFFNNNENLQIKHYKIARVNTVKKIEIVITNLKDNTSIYNTYINNMFNLSFDGQYLGVCDKNKLRIFDLNNNSYELEAYKDKQCTEVYFSLDNKYLILNNEGHGQIYDFHNAKLIYDNPNKAIVARKYSNSNLIFDYVMLENEIILLDEAKRIIVEWVKGTSDPVEVEYITLVKKDKDVMKVVIYGRPKPSYIPFVSRAPYYFVGNLQELQIMPKK